MSDGWQVEHGIGEERAILYRGNRAIAARIRWPGALEAGEIAEGTLIAKPKGAQRGRARFASGEEALVDKLPRDASEGADLRFLVTRSRIGEANRVKLAHVRPTDEPLRPAPSLADSLESARPMRAFPAGDWEAIYSVAAEGVLRFSGGSLHFAPTPAMTVVDVDGHLPARDLAFAAIAPLAEGIALFDLGGVIGVDFPTLEAKADRKAVDAAIEDALADFDHERTAMNGFGFVQIVSRFARPSLLHLLRHDPAGAAARLLLRRAERLEGPGSVELAAHPSVLARLSEEWLAELKRRTGKELSIRPDPALAIAAPHAQLIAA
ncbi:ribonuclease E/G [Aurantiacibacter aquimixticola]|uniref:Ribonuclease n=1 Tax=Aurantiacibacter aquimixticola TaxID=1958945 RepID=A0A419RQW8_9SPHN|nr:ribonuclease E/G [Aurantiacibacter aquimixticola]RJY08166.1 ribonuclease [Aurantiacibacter aquimixticola]